MAGPLGLEHCRVIEMANVVSGPLTGMLLADLGADVVKVEMPGTGDIFRRYDGQPGRIRPQFASLNRGKRSITLDVRQPSGLQAYLRFAESADVIIENFRPGTLERLDVGYEAIRRRNPAVVYCSITGAGSEGPYRDRPTYDAIAQALSGLWSQFTDMQRPEPVGPATSDQLTALYAVYGILAALASRAQTGRGQLVEVSMLGAAVAFQANAIAEYTMEGRIAGRRTRASRSLSFAFIASDRQPLAVHLSTPQKFWANLVSVLDHPELLDDQRFRTTADRIRNYDELESILAAIFRTRPRNEWLTRLAQHDVPAAPINNIAEAVVDPGVEAADLVRTFGSGERALLLAGFPVRFSDTPCEPGLPPPDIGEHTEALLQEAGYSSDEIARLLAEHSV